MFNYPYGNSEELNLDWLLLMMSNVSRMIEYLEKYCEYLESLINGAPVPKPVKPDLPTE